MTAPTWIVDDDGDLCYHDPDATDPGDCWIWIRATDLIADFEGATDTLDVDDAYEALATIVRDAENARTVTAEETAEVVGDLRAEVARLTDRLTQARNRVTEWVDGGESWGEIGYKLALLLTEGEQ